MNTEVIYFDKHIYSTKWEIPERHQGLFDKSDLRALQIGSIMFHKSFWVANCKYIWTLLGFHMLMHGLEV